MSLLNWLRKKTGNKAVQTAGPVRPATSLQLMQLEKRRLLNGDFSFLGGVELALDNVDADLVIQETNTSFEFILNNGLWNGTDVAGSATGNGSGLLSVNKNAFNSFADGVTIQAGTASMVSFDATVANFNLGNMPGELLVDGFATVNQSIGSAAFSDLTIRDAQLVTLQSVAADDIEIQTNELNFIGGANSVSGDNFSLVPNGVSTLLLGGSFDVANQLDFQDSDIDALSNGFSSLSFGLSSVTTNIVVDHLGASFGDAVTVNSGAGSIEIVGQLDTVADLDAAAIVLNGNGSGIVQSGNVITHTGTITINDGLLIDGVVRIDSTNLGQASAADIAVTGAIDGWNAGAADRLTINALFGLIDGVQDADVNLSSDVEGQSGPQSLSDGMDLERLWIEADTVRMPNVHAGQISVFAMDIDLQGNTYTSASDILFDGQLNLVSAGPLTITSGAATGDDIVVIGDIVDPASSSDVSISAGSADIELRGDAGSLTNPLGSMTVVDAGDVTLQSVITNGVLAVNSSSAQLQATQYISQQAGVSFSGDVSLSVAGAANVLVQSGGDQSVSIGGQVTGTNDSLTVESQGNVSLMSVAIGSGDLDVRVDSDNDAANALTVGTIAAQNVTLDGSVACDDSVALNGTINAGQAISIANFESLAVNSALTSGGSVSLSICDDITFGPNGSIASTGSVMLIADSDADGAGGIEMDAGSFIDASAATLAMTATQDVVISGLATTNATSSAVRIESIAGAIVDGGDQRPDIAANQSGAVTTLLAATGIGSSNPLDTHVSAVDAINATVGQIRLNETDDLKIHQLTQVNDGSISVVANGDIVVTASGTGIQVMESTTAGGAGDVLLQANSGTVSIDQAIVNNNSSGGDTTITANGIDQDVVLDAVVETATGSIQIVAEDSIQLTPTADLTAGSTGDIHLEANTGTSAGDSLGTIMMADGALIDAGSGTISLVTSPGASVGNIVLGGLFTTNNTANALLINSSGAVIDGGDLHRDIDADQTGARTTIIAVTGIGSGNNLEFSVDQLFLSNSQSGDITIQEDGDFSVTEIIQRENFDVHISVGGTLTVVEGGGGITILDDLAIDGTGRIKLHTIDGDIIVNDKLTVLGGGPDAGIVIDANGVGRDVVINSALTTNKGSVTADAEDSILLTPNANINAGDDGNVRLTSNASNVVGDTNNEIRMADGSVVDSNTGTIHLQATGSNAGDITVGSLITANATVDAVLLETNCSVIDGGDLGLDIDANQAGARTTILATTGIGSQQALEISADEIVAVNDDGVVNAFGNIELNETDDVQIVRLDNNASFVDGTSADGQTGAINLVAGGDAFVVDDGNNSNATIQSEKSIQLTAENISVDDDIVAVDDTAGTGGDADESIVIKARGNFELLDSRTISTDDAPGIRSVTPDVFTNDLVQIIADADGNAIDADGDLIRDEGIVFIAETASIRTDGGIANLLARRPDIDQTSTAFFDSTSVRVSEIEFIEISADEGNIYEGLVTVYVGNPGEENLILTVDWGDGLFSSDPTALQRLSTNGPTDLRNELDPDALGQFSPVVDGDKVQFLIPEGGREYVIPHRYSDFDVALDLANQPNRAEASDPFPVRFAVSHHAPSIEVVGTAIVDPANPQAAPIAVPVSDDVAPLARLSSTDVFDAPVDSSTRFDNGVTEFTILTRSVPRALLTKEVIEIPEVQEVVAAEDVVAASETIQAEEVATASTSGSVSSEDFFQLRRRYADGTTEVIIKRISEVAGDQLFDREQFEEFVREENLDDGSGYEIWLITSDPKGNVPVERPVFEFDVTAGKPGPASEELPDEFEELKLVPLNEDDQSEAPAGDKDRNADTNKPTTASSEELHQFKAVSVPLVPDELSNALERSVAETTTSAVATAMLVAAPEAVRFSRRARAVRRMRKAQDLNAVEDTAN